MNSGHSGKKAAVSTRALAGIALLFLVPLLVLAAPPAWWGEQQVLDAGSAPNDYAALNQGQLKNLANKAHAAMLVKLPTNVWSTTQGAALTAFVNSLTNSSSNYNAVNLGQLKNTAKKFYDVLMLPNVGVITGYPWAGHESQANDYAMANIGQAKNLFSFDLENINPPGHELPDWWQLLYFGGTGTDSEADSDGDGLSNWEEYEGESDPTDYYSQGSTTITPDITILSGGNQSGNPSAFSAEPLVVQVTYNSGPLANAPVVFAVAGDYPGLSYLNTTGAQLFSKITLYTDEYGIARLDTGGQIQTLYFRFDSTAGVAWQVQILAGGAIPALTVFTASDGASRPVITTPDTLEATLGGTFSHTITATGAPSSFGVDNLPPGLSFHTLSGVMSGTPTQEGKNPFVITATNSHGSSQKAVTLQVSNGGPVITSSLSVSVGRNEAFVYELEADYHPQSTTITGLISGLNYNPETCVLSGVFAQEGVYTFTLQAQNDEGSDTETLTVTVSAALPVIQSQSMVDDIALYEPFEYQIVASNNPTGYVAEELPEGFSIHSQSGLISGVPVKVGRYGVKLSISNVSGTTEDFLILEIAATPAAPKRIYITQNQPVSYQIPATGFATGYSAAGLPAGLSVHTQTGLITGTPTQIGTPEATITLSHPAHPCSYKQVFVVLSPTRNAASLMKFQQGVSPYSAYRSFSSGILSDTEDPNAIDHSGIASKIGAPEGTQIHRALAGFKLDTLPGDTQVTSASLQISGYPYGTVLPAIQAVSLPHRLDWNAISWNSVASLSSNYLATATPTQSSTFSLTFTSSTFSSEVASAWGNGREMSVLFKAPNTETISSPDRPRYVDFYNEFATAGQRPLLQVGYSTGAPPELFLPRQWDMARNTTSSLSIPVAHAPTGLSITGLPAGLTYSSSLSAGVVTISGTISTVTESTAILTATNANGVGSRTLKIRSLIAPVITSTNSWTFTAGQPATYTISATNNPISYTASGLPGGLTLDSTTGVISGTVNTAGNYTMTVGAQNVAGSGSISVNVRVQGNAVPVVAGGTASASAGVTFSYTISATQNPTSYGALGLPTGWTVNTNTGVITGLPSQVAQGSYTLTLSATNGQGTGTAGLQVTIEPAPLPIIQTRLIEGSVGADLYEFIEITNEYSTLTVSGLPSSLTHSSGSISGTPVAADEGTHTLTISATNEHGTDTKTASLIIHPAGPWIYGANYERNEGSVNPIYFNGNNGITSVIPGADFPEGLSIMPNGDGWRFEGTLAPGTYHFTVIVSDGVTTNEVPVTLIVHPLPSFTSPLQVTATAGQPFAYSLTAANSPIAYTITTASLPPGLTSSGNMIGGTLTTTAAGLYLVPVSATNAAGTRSSSLQITVSPGSSDLMAEFQSKIKPNASYSALIANIRSDSGVPTSVTDSLQTDGIFNVGRTSDTEVRRILLEYDLSSLPDDIQITSAMLTLSPTTQSATISGMVSVYQAAQVFATASPNWANNSGYVSPALSSRTLDQTYIGGPVPFYSSPAFAAAVTQSLQQGAPLDLVIAAFGLESGQTSASFGFVKSTAQPQSNPLLKVTYSLKTPTERPVIKPPLEVQGTITQSFSYQIKASHRPSSYAGTNLPAWLTLNTTSGVISGTPPSNAVGEYHVSLTATNGIGTSDPADLTLLIQSTTPVTQLQIVSGNQQIGVAGTVLPSPFVVRALNGSTTVSGALISFNVASGNGTFVAGTNRKSVVTDASGTASVSFQLPAVPGIVTATASTAGGVQTTFVATSALYVPGAGESDSAVNLRLVSGGGQSGVSGTALASPVVIQALDAWGSPLSGKTLTATATSGSGTITPSTSITDSNGKISLTVTPQGSVGTTNQFTVTESTSGAILNFIASVQSTSDSVDAGGVRSATLDSSAEQLSIGSMYVKGKDMNSQDSNGDEIYDPTHPIIGVSSISGNPASFLVQRKYDNQDWENVSASISVNTLTCSEPNTLLANRDYQYRVFAISSTGEKSAPVTASYNFSPLKGGDWSFDDKTSWSTGSDSDSWSAHWNVYGSSFWGGYWLYSAYYYELEPDSPWWAEWVRNATYQFQFYSSANSKFKWVELYVKEGNTSTQILNNRVVQLPSSQSPNYSIKGSSLPGDGEAYVIPAGDIQVGSADGYEKKNGLSVGKTVSSGQTFSVPWNHAIWFYGNWKNYSVTLSWEGSSFHVYAQTSNGQVEITNGQTVTAEQLWEYGGFTIVADENASAGATTTITWTISVNGETLNTDSAKFIYPDTRDYSMPIDEASGSRYRKIALNGMPLGDGKPQQAEESDQEPEETYVDALTLGLRHSTTDVYLQVPGSDLALSARRDLSSEVWSVRSGLRPQEDPSKPFGVCWSSNLTPSIKFVSSVNNPKPSEPDKAYVTDEGGATHAFFVTYGNFGSRSGIKFTPMPTAKNQQTPNLESLELDASTTPASYVFKRKYGNTIRYEMSSIDLVTPDDRLAGSTTQQKVTYARAKTVTDRLGYTLDYSYASASNLVPKTISVRNQPDLKLSIQQNSQGLITAIWDAKGNKTSFSYASESYASGVGAVSKLAFVTAPDGAETHYDYDFATEADLTPHDDMAPGNVHWHCDLKSITDPLTNKYEFAYALDHSKMNFKNDHDGTYPGAIGYYTQTGLPRNVQMVTMPDGKTAQFENKSKVWLAASTATGSSALVAQGMRQNVITDASGFKRTYTWGDSEVVPVPQVRKVYPETTSFSEPKLIAYKKMSVKHGDLGTEVFEFNLDAAMALKKITDFSGNVTIYNHADRWDESRTSNFRQALAADSTAYGYYGDPTSEVRFVTSTNSTVTLTKSYTYTTSARIMDSTTDALGRYTKYEVDSLGRRISEIIKASVSGDVKKSTSFSYAIASQPGFMTTRTVSALAGDQSGASSLVAQYIPDANGRIAQEIVDPGHLRLITSYAYDKNGNKTSATDPRGNTTWFSYDSRNRLTSVTYADGSQKQMIYDARGNKTREYDENGVATLYEYDSLNRLTAQIRDMNGNGVNDGRGTDLVTSHTYNAVNAKTSVTDPNGHRTKMAYDSLQRLVATTDPLGNVTSFEYGANSGGSAFDSSGFKPTRTVDPRGYVTTVTYDELYRPTVKSAQYSLNPVQLSTTTTSYDLVGNPTATIDPLGNRTETDYDALNRPTMTRVGVTTPGQVNTAYGYAQIHYTTTGLKWKVQDELWNLSQATMHLTETAYDTAGRPITVTGSLPFASSPDRPVTRTLYDAAGNIAATINPLGNRWDFAYDVRNRKTDELQPPVLDAVSGQTKRPHIRTGYDSVGNVLSVTDARGNKTETEYDAAYRKTKVTAPAVPLPGGGTAQPVTHMAYDANGNVLTLTDPNNHITRNTYDSLNRLVTTIDAANIAVINKYDAVGNRIAVIDGKGQKTEFAYDGLNRLLTTTDPAAKAVTLHYDALNKTQRVDSLNQTTGYGYDLRNRLTTITYSGRTTDNRFYNYDKVGNLQTVTQSGTIANVAYTYDALNRQVSETSGGFTHQYVYDLAGNRLTTTYGGTSRVLTSTYDPLNRLSTLTEGGRTSTYAYDLSGNIVQKTLPNGDKVLSGFDAINRTTTLSGTTTSSAALYTYTYSYDLASNVKSIAETYPGGLNNRTVANTYDNINRLTTEAITTGTSSVTTTYAYDAAHNRTGKVVTGGSSPGTTSYSYNQLNQLTTTSGLLSASYTYDDNGNRLTQTKGVQTDGYAYDYENRLVTLTKTITGPDLVTGTYNYAYDYRTRRILRDESTAGGVATKLVFSGGTSVQEYTVSGTNSSLVVEYLRGSDYGGGIGGILYTLRGGVPSYTHENRRGDVIAKTDGSGSLTYQAVYEAYGKRTQEQGSTLDRQKANTKDEDPTGLLNEGFRYRDLDTGTFITRDPLGFVDGPNLYTYVRQNPWTMFDPQGLASDRVDDDGFEWSDRDHHMVPRETAKDSGWKPEAKKVFDDDSAKISTKGVGHNNSAHSKYNKEVAAEMAEFLKSQKVKNLGSLSAKDQAELAKKFVDHISKTNNAYIKGFNEAVSKGPEAVKAWYASVGKKIVLKSTGLEARAGGKIITGMANAIGTGGKVLAKGLPIVAGAIVAGQSLAHGKDANGAAQDVVMNLTGADMLQFAAEELAGLVTPAIEQRNQQLQQAKDDVEAGVYGERPSWMQPPQGQEQDQEQNTP